MRRVERATITARAVHNAAPFLTLDLAVMVRLAHRLPILAIPEELEITTMWDTVVDDSCGYYPAFGLAPYAQRIRSEEVKAGLLPLAAIAALT